MTALKLTITVKAGVIPGHPIMEKAWDWTSDDQARLENQEDPVAQKEAQAEYIRMAGESRELAASLENPRQFNWVERVWIWM